MNQKQSMMPFCGLGQNLPVEVGDGLVVGVAELPPHVTLQQLRVYLLHLGHRVLREEKWRVNLGFDFNSFNLGEKFPFCDHEQTTKDDKRR